MAVIFSKTEATISLFQIEELENFFGFIFPDEYKKHLQKNNGGQCTPNMFGFNERGKQTYSSIDWFLAIYDGEYDNLEDYIITYKVKEKRLPSHILPIAHDPGGNLICISCGNNDYGYVYFWDHESEVNYNISNNNDYGNLHLIAKGLNEFIDSLKEEI